MMNYNKGDKFIIEIDEIFENSEDDIIHEEKLYRIKGFRSLVFDDNGLDKLEKLDVIKDKMVRKCVADNYRDEAFKVGYNKGLNDAWELANKISDIYSASERARIFNYVVGGITVMDILRDFAPQEALAELEAYEKEQAEIKVGDVVEVQGHLQKCVVTQAILYNLELVDSCGNTFRANKDEVKKTGKHIDIQKLLDELKEG